MDHPELRQIAGVDGRSLHLRRFGRGRPLVLMHESPRSSAALLPLATRLAEHFTVLALDTPGYGSSDPLPLHRPEIADFADAVAASLRTLGLSRVPVYGTHTGATIAAEMGRRHPDLVSGLVLDGYPVFTVAERDLHHAFYLPPFPPQWNGSHVAALWARVRDQFDFFPWYALNEAARLRTAKAPLERHRAVLRDFLAAGAHYSTAYAASFRFEALSVLQELRVPTHVMARATDLLFSHLERLGPLPSACAVAALPADPDEWATAVRVRLETMSGDDRAPASLDRLDPSPIGQRGVFDGRLLVRCYGRPVEQRAGPVVLLHDTPGSALEWNDVATRLAADRLVVVPDLPNHGVSPDMAPEAGLDGLRDLLAGLFASLGQTLSVVGRGMGAVLAADLAAGRGTSIARALAVDLPDPAAPIAPADEPLPPRWDGADLLADWFAVRDDALYGPGGDARRGPAALTAIGFDVAAIHDRFRARVMAAGQDRVYAAALRGAMAARGGPDAGLRRLVSQAGPPIGPRRLSDVVRAAIDGHA